MLAGTITHAKTAVITYLFTACPTKKAQFWLPNRAILIDCLEFGLSASPKHKKYLTNQENSCKSCFIDITCSVLRIRYISTQLNRKSRTQVSNTFKSVSVFTNKIIILSLYNFFRSVSDTSQIKLRLTAWCDQNLSNRALNAFVTGMATDLWWISWVYV